jgi:hypothetical protein
MAKGYGLVRKAIKKYLLGEATEEPMAPAPKPGEAPKSKAAPSLLRSESGFSGKQVKQMENFGSDLRSVNTRRKEMDEIMKQQ